MRAGAAAKEREPIVQRAELGCERVGDAGLEPADAAGRPPRQDRSRRIGVTQRAVDAVETPDREHVRGVAAADHHDVLLADERRDVLDLAVEEGEVRRLAVHPGKLLIEGQQVARAVARGGRQEEHARPLASREREEVPRERRKEELSTATRQDPTWHLGPGRER